MGKIVKCPDGGPAYPHTNWVENPTNGKRIVKGVHPGLSKLEVFAKAATTDGIDWGLACEQGLSVEDKWRKIAALEAKIKFIKAEAMLAELERRRDKVMSYKPKTAEERVKIILHAPNDYRVVADGVEELDKYWLESSAENVRVSRIALINTTVEMCCALVCPHCKEGIPIRYTKAFIYHDSPENDLLCKAVAIRRELRVQPIEDYPLCSRCGHRTSPPMFSNETGKHPCDNCGKDVG